MLDASAVTFLIRFRSGSGSGVGVEDGSVLGVGVGDGSDGDGGADVLGPAVTGPETAGPTRGRATRKATYPRATASTIAMATRAIVRPVRFGGGGGGGWAVGGLAAGGLSAGGLSAGGLSAGGLTTGVDDVDCVPELATGLGRRYAGTRGVDEGSVSSGSRASIGLFSPVATSASSLPSLLTWSSKTSGWRQLGHRAGRPGGIRSLHFGQFRGPAYAPALITHLRSALVSALPIQHRPQISSSRAA